MESHAERIYKLDDMGPADMKEFIKKNFNSEDRWIFIITGISGPTGKTWLDNKLTSAGYRAFELAYNLGFHTHFGDDDKNRLYIDRINNVVYVLLNKRIERQ